ncbi:M48 family metallopeptidase [Marinigracilibium pacificum]|uniref:M48 family metallopeptidase n=1 Tax=Marinigracilibium pacificum TaxID=2729599 RepID=A0A848IWR2_9BACT|nr:M48 family metallopeptidase [Marinigracilibium pacificum]NMM48106.1 M48 family metallopeptidase [Marinigracilibium pacificum]
MKKVLAIFFVAFIIYGCATVPVTGRRQLSLVSNEELIPVAFQQYDAFLDSSKVIKGTSQAKMVSNVGARIKSAVERYLSENNSSELINGFDWEFTLVDENIANAWCLPGGKVAFYTGIMPICENETGVAVVMGHEVAHAIANHGRERISNAMILQGAIGTFGALMGQNPSVGQELILQGFGVGGQLGMLSFSRKHESEADKIGLIFMSMAGYNPQEAVDFWGRMSDASGGQQPPEFISTHPSHSTRIEDLKAAMPEAMEYYKKNK